MVCFITIYSRFFVSFYRPCLCLLVFLVTGCADQPTTPVTEFLLKELEPLRTPSGRLLRDGVSQADSLLLLGPPLEMVEMVGLQEGAASTMPCSTSYSTTAVSGGCAAIQVIPATPYLRHSGGIHEPEQKQPIAINFSRPITSFTISGKGAIKCTGTYGQVSGFGGTLIGTIDLVLIDPADCGDDDVTHGAKATITFSSPVSKIVVDGPLPWLFMVYTSQGRALADYSISWVQADVHDIRPIFFGSPLLSQAMQDVVNQAILKWQKVIHVGSIPLDTVSLAAGQCGSGSPVFQEIVGGIRLMVKVQPDTVKNRLAYAQPCKRRTSGALIPSVAFISIKDSLELFLGTPEGRIQVQDIITHEIGHALGIGLGNPWKSKIDSLVALKPWFTGTNARSKFLELSFQYPDVYVPVTALDPLNPGVQWQHWSDKRMGSELMTQYVGGTMALSKITLGALVDLGYAVNFNQADSYTVPVYDASAAQVMGDLISGPEMGSLIGRELNCNPPE